MSMLIPLYNVHYLVGHAEGDFTSPVSLKPLRCSAYSLSRCIWNRPPQTELRHHLFHEDHEKQKPPYEADITQPSLPSPECPHKHQSTSKGEFFPKLMLPPPPAALGLPPLLPLPSSRVPLFPNSQDSPVTRVYHLQCWQLSCKTAIGSSLLLANF